MIQDECELYLVANYGWVASYGYFIAAMEFYERDMAIASYKIMASVMCYPLHNINLLYGTSPWHPPVSS